MKKLFSIVALLAFASSVYAGCPSKPIHGKVIGFDDRGKVKLSMKRVDQDTGEDIENKKED